MSSLALLLARAGIPVSGTDRGIRPATAAKLEREGIHVYREHQADHLQSVDLVIVSSAIPEENPELQTALRLAIPLCHRVDMLVRLAVGKRTLTVAGTHGKGTTTGLLASILVRAGWAPSLANGAELVDFGERCWWGEGGYFVMESDESDGSFLKLHPQAGLVTNIDRDHLNFWGDEAGLREGFCRFSENVTETLIAFEGAMDSLSPRSSGRNVLLYGRGDRVDYQLRSLYSREDGQEMVVKTPMGHLSFCTPLVGEHNALNVLGSLAMADALGVPRGATREAIASYHGIRRRLERRKSWNGALVFDDHADHPTEITRTIAALLPLGRPILAVLQPHRFSRVRALLEEYGPALREASKVVVLPTYAAGEKIDYQLHDQDIFERIRHANPGKDVRFTTRPDLVPLLRSFLHPGEVLLLMGPGDIEEVAEELEVLHA